MKNTIKITALLLAVTALILCLASCEKTEPPSDLWSSAIYKEDTTLGNGANTVKVKITAGDRSVTLTVKTDKATLGDALYEEGLLNDPSFFDTCNGICANWKKDAAYWGFFVDGELATYGINDEAAATSGTHSYEIVYTK